MSFTASTVRRVLYEGGPARFLYAIGNTPAKAVLPAGDDPLDGPVKLRVRLAAEQQQQQHLKQKQKQKQNQNQQQQQHLGASE
jgi:hypothetical protein